MMDYQTLFLTAQGRINRLTFLIGAAILYVVDIVLVAIFFATMEHGLISALIALVAVALMYPALCIAIKRFHDRDKSGWWVLITFVPLIGGVWYIVETFFLPGTVGPNKYGPDTVTA
jgi:uncharacterized membrane protein YhaH (DUF805 family)